jgi:hypothetical protein
MMIFSIESGWRTLYTWIGNPAPDRTWKKHTPLSYQLFFGYAARLWRRCSHAQLLLRGFEVGPEVRYAKKIRFLCLVWYSRSRILGPCSATPDTRPHCANRTDGMQHIWDTLHEDLKPCSSQVTMKNRERGKTSCSMSISSKLNNAPRACYDSSFRRISRIGAS